MYHHLVVAILISLCTLYDSIQYQDSAISFTTQNTTRFDDHFTSDYDLRMDYQPLNDNNVLIFRLFVM